VDAILTHENADFDAVASLLGAKKSYPQALAILPHKTNRNVRDFCSLYGDALAFTRPEDLPRQKFRQVIIVDTQSAPSMRGITRETRIHIVDHHPQSRDLAKGASFTGGDVGATTTLFVEEIGDKELPITPIEATLLLLGIYEDTGSLSYSDTSVRDLRAAAFLLERGANLTEVNEFLHHPLNEAQRNLYHALLEKIETVRIAGHDIAIATARADDYVEEISTLAHQLRELFDPAALFVLVQMEDHIQLVARSDRPSIDVGSIAEALGGGGHATAAAAVLRKTDLRKAKIKLIKLLKESVRPTVTVRELMSFGVHTLDPSATVEQAAEMMNRYGHEGFPVAQKEKLVGVVTRRDVDRAIHHKLANTPIKHLMHKPVSVAPEDSLETLRQAMIESDLGQVPVVDAKGRQILGIVTRTDVIKQAEPARPARAREMATRLEKWMPIDLLDLVHHASETARELGFSLYVVGGFVRDLLLNQPNLDLDLVVEGDAIKLAEQLARRFGGRVHGHSRFGTAKWMLGEGAKQLPSAPHLTHLDFTTARTEFYAHPSALPEVETSSIKQDLRRRDFTINTLAICLDPDRYGQLLDPFGGEADLREGVIRVLHHLSFVEDPTRILRAVRFEQRFGFKIETRTAELLTNALDMLSRVSGERIRHELSLIFQETEPEKPMLRLNELGALKAIYPMLVFTRWHADKFVAARTESKLAPIIYFGLVVYHWGAKDVEEISRRLRFSNSEAEMLKQVVALREESSALEAPRLQPSAIHRLLSGYSDDALTVVSVAADNNRVSERIDAFRTKWRRVAPEMTGNDLKRMGISPGPTYRDILSKLLDARLDGKITNRAQEENLAQEILNAGATTPRKG
jgi:tRNA nucleotidyltransferase (CCA-adding enzyme)